MTSNVNSRVNLREREPLLPFDDWYRYQFQVGDTLDIDTDITIPASLHAILPAELKGMYDEYVNLIYEAQRLYEYYENFDPRYELVTGQAEYYARRLLAHRYLRLLTAPRGLLLTLKDENYNDVLVNFGRLGPFCQADDAQEAFTRVFDDPSMGTWDDTAFAQWEIEKKTARYVQRLMKFDSSYQGRRPAGCEYDENATYRMRGYKDKVHSLRTEIRNFTERRSRACVRLAREQSKGDEEDLDASGRLEKMIQQCSERIAVRENKVETLHCNMNVQYQIESFLVCRGSGQPCPRLLFEYPESDAEADTPRAGHSANAGSVSYNETLDRSSECSDMEEEDMLIESDDEYTVSEVDPYSDPYSEAFPYNEAFRYGEFEGYI